MQHLLTQTVNQVDK